MHTNKFWYTKRRDIPAPAVASRLTGTAGDLLEAWLPWTCMLLLYELTIIQKIAIRSLGSRPTFLLQMERVLVASMRPAMPVHIAKRFALVKFFVTFFQQAPEGFRFKWYPRGSERCYAVKSRIINEEHAMNRDTWGKWISGVWSDTPLD